MDKPRYAVMVLMDQPKATKDTFGFATAGYTAAPADGPHHPAHRAAAGGSQYSAASAPPTKLAGGPT